MDKLKDWTYKNGIQGIEFSFAPGLPRPTIDPEDYE